MFWNDEEKKFFSKTILATLAAITSVALVVCGIVWASTPTGPAPIGKIFKKPLVAGDLGYICAGVFPVKRLPRHKHARMSLFVADDSGNAVGRQHGQIAPLIGIRCMRYRAPVGVDRVHVWGSIVTKQFYVKLRETTLPVIHG
jgi:hypothetical protein